MLLLYPLLSLLAKPNWTLRSSSCLSLMKNYKKFMIDANPGKRKHPVQLMNFNLSYISKCARISRVFPEYYLLCGKIMAIKALY